ncbi:MAG: helix-turn-helix domain-containing protein [Armatimonadota bacterium]
MAQSKLQDYKREILKKQGALNPHPERVTDPLFLENDFFDPLDLVQTKYEMLRRVHKEGQSVSSAAASFGFSRVSFYQAQAAFREQGLAGLVPSRRGPHGAHKLSDQVIEFMRQAMDEDESLRPSALAVLVEGRFGFSIHPRSIERALAGCQKKQRGKR